MRISFYNRDPIVVQTPPTSVGQILADRGITLRDGEQPSVGLWDQLTADTECSVDLYEYVYEDVTETILKLDKVSPMYQVSVVISLALDKEELPEAVQDKIFISL